MPKFVTIGCGDQPGYDRTPKAIRDAAHEHDAKQRKAGTLMGIAGTSIQVRNPEFARVVSSTGPYMTSHLPVAGFSIFEAGSLAEAIELASKSPCAVAHGVVEVWPLQDPPS